MKYKIGLIRNCGIDVYLIAILSITFDKFLKGESNISPFTS